MSANGQLYHPMNMPNADRLQTIEQETVYLLTSTARGTMGHRRNGSQLRPVNLRRLGGSPGKPRAARSPSSRRRKTTSGSGSNPATYNLW